MLWRYGQGNVKYILLGPEEAASRFICHAQHVWLPGLHACEQPCSFWIIWAVSVKATVNTSSLLKLKWLFRRHLAWNTSILFLLIEQFTLLPLTNVCYQRRLDSESFLFEVVCQLNHVKVMHEEISWLTLVGSQHKCHQLWKCLWSVQSTNAQVLGK